MKKLFAFAFLAILLLNACGPSTNTDDTFYYVTRLGSDTLAIERIHKGENQLKAEVVLRSPNISLTSYDIQWDEENKLVSLTSTRHENDFKSEGVISQSIEASGDSLIIESQGRNGMTSTSILNEDNYLPFIDMVHWPFDIAFNRAHLTAADSIHQYLLSGRRASDFIIFRTADKEYTLRHPSRGVMYVQTDDQGNMVWLDAKETTRKLIVERVSDLDFDVLTQKYLEIDAKGSPFGTLSPAEEAEFSFGGSDFKVSFGSPQKRGRDIFGGIVPYGEVWRTGANTASHFSTTKDIYIANQKIPTGEYTLFSIPEEDGGTLIINSQTGQNGQAYDATKDFVRIPMMRDSNRESIEGFTIQIVKTNTGGSLELLWDKTIYYVNFTFE
ncbi:MAG TPA: DUF2911 domain-containing protein [Roseivirga sp.]